MSAQIEPGSRTSVSASRLTDLQTLLTEAGPPRRALAGLREGAADQVIAVAHETFVYAMARTMLLSVAVCAVAATIALLLIRPGRQRAARE